MLTGPTNSPAAKVHSAASPAPTRLPTGAPAGSEAVRGARQEGGSQRAPVTGVHSAVAPVHGSRHSTRTRIGAPCTASGSSGTASTSSRRSPPVTRTSTACAPIAVARRLRPGIPVAICRVHSLRPEGGALPSQLRGDTVVAFPG